MNEKPNILLIMADQWRAECFGFIGHPVVKTPNIDKLAQGSVWFENTFTVTPLCSPARGSLLSAQWPHVNGVIDNIGVGVSKQKPLGRSCHTWLDAAVENGFMTGYFGKWHLGNESAKSRIVDYNAVGNDPNGPNPNGIGPATERGELLEGAIEKYTPKTIFPGDRPPFYAKLDGGVEKMVEHRITNCALNFLQGNGGNPWSLTVSYYGPHFPHTIPQPYASMYSLDSIELPKNMYDRFIMKPWFQNRHWWPSMVTENLTEEEWRKTAAAYYGYMTFLDDEIGRLLAAAEKASRDRRTVVLFTADHGEMLGAHSRFDKGAYFYDEVLRIPLLVKQDLSGHRMGECTVCSEYCNIMDVGATIFELAGSTYKAAGRSLMPLIEGSSKDRWPDEAFGAYYRYNGHSFEVRTVRTPEWKYSYVPQDIDELYDLRNDPGEMINLADRPEYKSVKEQHRARLYQWMRENNDPLVEKHCVLPPAGTLLT